MGRCGVRLAVIQGGQAVDTAAVVAQDSDLGQRLFQMPGQDVQDSILTANDEFVLSETGVFGGSGGGSRFACCSTRIFGLFDERIQIGSFNAHFPADSVSRQIAALDHLINRKTGNFENFGHFLRRVGEGFRHGCTSFSEYVFFPKLLRSYYNKQYNNAIRF